MNEYLLCVACDAGGYGAAYVGSPAMAAYDPCPLAACLGAIRRRMFMLRKYGKEAL